MRALMILAHPDDEVMCFQTLSILSKHIKHLDIVTAVHGVNAKVFDIAPLEIWTSERVSKQRVAEIRTNEQFKSIRSLGFSSFTQYFLKLIDKGWRKNGILGQEVEVETSLMKYLQNRHYDLIIAPYTVKKRLSPSKWVHPDHYCLSNIFDNKLSDLTKNIAVLRYIFYNEITPINEITIPDDYSVRIQKYKGNAYLRQKKHIQHCYPSQESTLFKIIGKSHNSVIDQYWKKMQTELYYALGVGTNVTSKDEYFEITLANSQFNKLLANK
jgi:hypothetical protein